MTPTQPILNLMKVSPTMYDFLVRNGMITETGKNQPTVGNIIITKHGKNNKDNPTIS